MYSSASKSKHFRSETGSSSVRIKARGYGGKSQFGEAIAILETLPRQAASIFEQIATGDVELRRAPSYEEASSVQDRQKRLFVEYSKLQHVIRTGRQLAQETVFLKVAQSRLPKDLFTSIMEECKDVLRGEGAYGFEKIPNVPDDLRLRAHRNLSPDNWSVQLLTAAPPREVVDEIIRLGKRGVSPTGVAKQFRMSVNTVVRIMESAGLEYDFDAAAYVCAKPNRGIDKPSGLTPNQAAS